MPNYFYTAKSFDGQTKTGDIFAKDLHELATVLKDQDMILIKAIDQEKKEKKNTFVLPSFSSGVPAVEKIMMVKNLQVMIAAGLSVVKSFQVLSNQTKKKKLKMALIDIKKKISKGDSLSSALSHYPAIFSEFFLSMVKVGEESGTLEEVLKVLSSQLEKEHRLKSKIQGAMIYPCIILVVMIMVGIVVATVVLPSLDSFFSSLNTEMPFYTKMIIWAGRFSVRYWPLLIITPLALFGSLWMVLKTKWGKKAEDAVLLKVPLFSPLVKKSNCAVLIRSLSSLIASGVPFTRSLEVTAETVGNYYFKKALQESLEKVKKGDKLSKALASYQDIFPFGIIEMIEVGEETGKTSTILKELANFYEEETIAATEKLSAAIEPILIVVLGLSVGFFAISIIEPMYSSLGAIH
jgi:type II secretory pathway component PulF